MHQDAFSQFQLKIGGGQAGFLQDQFDPGEKILVTKLDGRNIHRDRHGKKTALQPELRLPAGFTQRPATNRHDQAALFRNRHKAPRVEQTDIRIKPANQRLDAGHLAGGKIDLRLVMQEKFTPLQGPAQAAFDLLPADRLGIHLAGKKLVSVTAIGFGVVHRGIGVLHHGFDVVAVIRINTDADTQGDMQILPADHMRQGESREQFLRDQGCIVGPGDFGQQNHELIPALTADRIGNPDAGSQTLGDRLQQLVTDRVPERVVDVFEMIEIEKKQCDLLVMALGQTDRLGQALGQQRAVRQVGEKIVLGQVGHFQGHCPRFTDVVEDNDRAGILAVPVVNGRSGILNRRLMTIAANQHAICGQPDGAVFLNGARCRIRGHLAGGAVNDVEYFGKWMAQGVLP